MNRLNFDYIKKISDFLDCNPCVDFEWRKEIVYPLLDQVFSDDQKFSISLKSGLKFDFLYKSNIAKEILLRVDEVPDHVWEPMTTKSVCNILCSRPGSVVIGGAYFGDHAVIAADLLRKSSSEASVLCVEPNSIQRQILFDNAQQNDLERYIECIDAVLWNKQGLFFDLNDADSHACVSEGSGGTKSLTIDSIVAKYKPKFVSLLLLDIEGSEEPALEGAKNLLSLNKEQAPHIIVEVHRNYVDWSKGLENTSLCKLLNEFGYYVYALRDCQSNQNYEFDYVEIIPLGSVYLEGPPHGFNLIASKDKSFFAQSWFREVFNVSPKYLPHRNLDLHAPISS